MKLRSLVTLLVTVLLVACHTGAPIRLGAPQFTGPAFRFNAGKLELKKSAQVLVTDIQSKYNFPTRIDTGVEKWVNQRVQTVGGENRFEVDIQQSSVMEEELPTTQGFMGVFQDEQSRRYTGHLKLALNLYSPDRYTARAGVVSEAHQSITVPESASVAERQQAFNDLVIKMLQQVDADLSQRIPQYFAPYLAGY